jgi:hypothetical protein
MSLGRILVAWLIVIVASGIALAQLPTSEAVNGSTRHAQEQWIQHGAIAALRYRAYQQKLKMRRAPAAIPSGGAIWTSLGPAPLASSGVGPGTYNWVSGRATAIAIDPSDATGNTVFAGGAYGGVWESTNAGAASPSPATVVWRAATDDQATLAVGSIAVQPWSSGLVACVNNPGESIVLVGTGETDSSADSYYGLGILHSFDVEITGTSYSKIPVAVYSRDWASARLHSALLPRI